ncbi:ribosomal RNA small subunit methyltransferase A [Candidatus Kaiserbacteria bacterium CG10_big_fil_rev_8_21_14_0_10_56_12]|uniref:Ribosomal RNA small subunit methyltransferase A n=1 Tax=Candidatus Kaiserbacteria bacterium CG10_big_fil_rev_8_21_14_0_10_56_12 TaxID=1974611 RepID=A0A2H0U9D0_9BACT|nr:MAG: ribosomal RNA small subunit methyltransferase A [Candidatus Kaiserbacteria bacterium CG10_big_fil_rev_8_21_14_0_10_56_12]
MHAKKSLGQHFLMHARIAERIALVSGVTSDDVVFEIGPGTGMLTRELLKRARKVIALEADQELFDKLKGEFESEIRQNRLELLQGDIRAFDISTLSKGYTLVANIPYYLTGEIFRMFLESENQPATLTLLVQKEVAERIARSKKESLLSLSVKVYGDPHHEFTVPRGAFVPAPAVDSAVLTVRNISRKKFSSREEEERFFVMLRAGFAHKRKFLGTNLKEAGFQASTLRAQVRAEDVSVEEWLSELRAGV